MLRDIVNLSRCARPAAAGVAALLLVGVAACGSRGAAGVSTLPALAPQLPAAAPAARSLAPAGSHHRRNAKQTGIAVFTIVVPRTGVGGGSGYVPAGTHAVGISAKLNGNGQARSAFYVLGRGRKYCRKGGSVALTCRLGLRVRAGNEAFVVQAHAKTAASSSVTASGAVNQTIVAGTTSSVPVTMGSSPTPTPSAAPTTAPTSAPTGQPTSAPTSAPTTAPTSAPTTAPTPVGSGVAVSPSSVQICPSSGSDACADSQTRVTVTQSGSTGSFTLASACSSNLATVTLYQKSGSSATYTIIGQSTSGTCSVRFNGNGGAHAALQISVTSGGIGINTIPGHHSR